MEAGQASVVTPVILRHWLVDKFIRAEVRSVIHSSASRFLGGTTREFSASEIIVQAFWNIAVSNIQVCGRQAPVRTRQEFLEIVVLGRKSMQFLFHVASEANKKSAKQARSSKQSMLHGFMIFSAYGLSYFSSCFLDC